MKFLIDAQLPYRLKTWLLAVGFDAIHTSDLPKQNLTEDLEIAHVADSTQRTVITKDSDFLKLKILQNKPEKLLLITRGNIITINCLLCLSAIWILRFNFSQLTRLSKSIIPL